MEITGPVPGGGFTSVRGEAGRVAASELSAERHASRDDEQDDQQGVQEIALVRGERLPRPGSAGRLPSFPRRPVSPAGRGMRVANSLPPLAEVVHDRGSHLALFGATPRHAYRIGNRGVLYTIWQLFRKLTNY